MYLKPRRRRRLRPPFALVPSVLQHASKFTTYAKKELIPRFSQATVSRSRLPPKEFGNCGYRSRHLDAPTSNPNAIRVRMEVLPRHLPVAMGEGRRNRRCENLTLRPINTLTTNTLRITRLRSPPRKHPPILHCNPLSTRTIPARTLTRKSHLSTTPSNHKRELAQSQQQ